MNHPRPEDGPAVAGLLAAAEQAHLGSSVYSEELLSDDWMLPVFDLTTDAWLVADHNGELAGYAWVFRFGEEPRVFGFARVHPDHCGRGLGTILLALRERRAGDLLAGREGSVVTEVLGGDNAGSQLVEGLGYQMVRRGVHMTVDLEQVPVGTGSAGGMEIRSFVPGRDEPEVHRVFMEAFAGQWGSVPMTLEEWVQLRIDWEGFDPSLWFLAVDGRQVSGAVSGRIIEGVGWVTTLGVLPQYRGRGIGRSLLEHSLQEFRRRGVAVAKLEVDAANRTGATRLYERVGMRIEREYLLYEKRVDQVSDPPTANPD